MIIMTLAALLSLRLRVHSDFEKLPTDKPTLC